MARKNCPHILRRVVVWDKDEKCEIVLLTNYLDFGATTISAIYKDRWQIELFFKALKQNLKVKTFVGTAEKGQIGVVNDWGKLREVMAGYPDERVESHYSSTLAWITEEAKAMATQYGGKNTAEVLQENTRQLKDQVQRHVKILEDFGVKVHRARKIFAHPGEARYLDQIQRGCQPFGDQTISRYSIRQSIRR